MSELERDLAAVMFPSAGRHEVISDRDLHTAAHWFAKTAIVINSSQNYRAMVPEAVHGIGAGVRRIRHPIDERAA
jgi:hypothetical protein